MSDLLCPKLTELLYILGECLTCLVSGGSSDLCLMESPQHIDGGECPPACVTADQLVLREELGLNHSVDLGLPLDILIEFPSYVLQEFLHISVIGRDVSLDRCFVTIFLQNNICNLFAVKTLYISQMKPLIYCS